jgi:choice-of-anchor B domain-containing protein
MFRVNYFFVVAILIFLSCDDNNPDTHTLTTNIIPENAGTILPSSNIEVEEDSKVELSAIAEEGYRFKNWTCNVTSTENPLELIITSDTEITANFIENNSSDAPQYPCINGLAKNTYPCAGLDLYAHLTPSQLGGNGLNDIWGWKDPKTEKLYAIVGLTDGISFVDITNPNAPIVVGNLDESSISAKRLNLNNLDNDLCKFGIGSTQRAKSITEGSVWRDHKVYNDHLYIVSDAQAHGMQVFDLTRLRNCDCTRCSFTEDYLYNEIANAHNIVINEQTSFAYVVGATNNVNINSVNNCNDGGLHMIDLSNPVSPTFVGCYNDTKPPRRGSGSAYIHDAQCVIYNGSDAEYAGKELCFSSAERSVVITDVSDKNNPVTVGFTTNPNVQYTHQGWLTEDHAFLVVNDELDEYNLGRATKTHIFDVRDLENPSFIGSYTHSSNSIDHNLYIKNNKIYLTNYTSGLRVLQFGDLSTLDIAEIAYFDSQPTNNNALFEGTWSNYPFFEEDIIIISDIEDGLFILKPNF